MSKQEGFNEAFGKMIREEEDIYEAHWRKTLADGIEAMKFESCITHDIAYNAGLQDAADFARGLK